MNNLRLLWQHMKGNRLLYLGAILSIGMAALFSALNPLVLRVTIDSIIGSQPVRYLLLQKFLPELGAEGLKLSYLGLAALAVVLITVCRGFFLFIKGKWAATAAEKTAKNLRERLYDHLQHLPYEYHTRSETGDLIQRCTSDLDTIRRFLAMQFVEIGKAVFLVTFIAAIMFSLHVKMALAAMGVVPIIFAFSYFYYQRVKKSFKEADEAEARMTTRLQENLTGVRVVRAFARQAYEVEEFDQKNSEHRAKSYQVLRQLAWFWSVSDFLSLMQIAVVVILGAYWTVRGELTLGTLVVFTTYEGMFLWPVRQMGRILTEMGKALVSAERIQEILAEKQEVEAESNFKPEINGDIEFDNVSFQYESDKQVLKDISFTVEEGETVAITGPTGAGKSTLMHLLVRLYDYQQGSIKIGGQEVQEINRKWLRENIGLILQDPFLFAKTVKDNIALARTNLKDSEIFEAANNAAVHDVILDFEEGYDTKVGERGVSLSGGQKQRLAIARMLIRDCPILVFDDSLSAVDTETDKAIRAALKEENQQRTTFIIAHRVNTLAEADKILVLEEGELVQMGTHEELKEEPGMYRRIWKLQTSLEGEMDLEEEEV